MRLRTDEAVLRDEHGRQRVLHGINMVDKGHPGATSAADFEGAWSSADVADLADMGFTVVRLGLIWAAVEPAPGEYSEHYLAWIGSQLDMFDRHGIGVILDAHQDLYSQSFADGAPAWATLTEEPFEASDLWSDAYLASPAVHQALDAFWANAPGPGGVGLQDRFAAMWAETAARFRDHPALLGYDILNEPAPGSAAGEIFGALIGAFAEATGQDPQLVAVDFASPEAKFAQLGLLDEVATHRAIGDAVAPLLAAFERDAVAPFMDKVTRAIRAVDPDGLILREHDYFANLGIPSGQPPLDDSAWLYSPHGYDLTVDTEAIALSSNTRASTIFERCRETADRLNVPVLVGEWGAFGAAPGVTNHAAHLLDVFDSHHWSWTYWCWEEGFTATEGASALRRPRPLAFAGDATGWEVTETAFTAAWHGRAGDAPSEFWLPDAAEAAISVTRDGVPVDATLDGNRVLVDAADGFHEFSAAWDR